MEMKKGNHSIYCLNYHVVFVVKYRKKCITPEIGEFLLDNARRLLEKWDGELLEGNTDLDHIHLLISMNPKYELARYIGSLKNSLARNVRKQYGDELKEYLWGDSFWSDSYYIASTGGADLDTVKKYIEDQGKPKRRYTKKPKQ
jgi:putative transposase